MRSKVIIILIVACIVFIGATYLALQEKKAETPEQSVRAYITTLEDIIRKMPILKDNKMIPVLLAKTKVSVVDTRIIDEDRAEVDITIDTYELQSAAVQAAMEKATDTLEVAAENTVEAQQQLKVAQAADAVIGLISSGNMPTVKTELTVELMRVQGIWVVSGNKLYDIMNVITGGLFTTIEQVLGIVVVAP